MMKKIIFLLLSVLAFLHASAQKLPNVQQVSLRAPTNVKIDGKATEWGTQFQAYNNATDLYYSMANDDKNLYLVIQSPDAHIISRIVARGITLDIQNEVKKKEANSISITYPSGQGDAYFDLQNKGRIAADTSDAAIAETVDRYNKLINDRWKVIKLNTAPGVDSLISVYNVAGVNATAKFAGKKVFTWEVSVDLKYLKALTNSKFAYHITVNGHKPLLLPAGPLVIIRTGGPTGPVEEKASEELRAGIERINQTNGPTYFWGEYTLAK